MTRVWQHSHQKAGALLVLLAIADYANDEGQAFPSVASLMAKARMSERGVQGAIAQLVKSDELRIDKQAGPKGCNLYSVLVDPTGADSAPPQIPHPRKTRHAGGADFDRGGANFVSQTAPEPSTTVNKNRQRTVSEDGPFFDDGFDPVAETQRRLAVRT